MSVATTTTRDTLRSVDRLARLSRAKGGFLDNVATVFTGQIACALASLAIEICYTRLLGPAGRGQVSLCMMIVALCAMFAGLGGEIPLTIWTAKRKEHSAAWLRAVSLIGVAGSVAAGILWTFCYWRWHPIFLRELTTTLAVLVLPAIPLNVSFSYMLALFTGLERFSIRAGVTLLSQTYELASILFLIFLFGRRAELAVAGTLLGLLLAAIIGAAILKRQLSELTNSSVCLAEIKAALSLGARSLGNLATFFSYRLDVFVLSYFLDLAHVGWYALGVVISESLWQLPQAVATALFPRTARSAERDSAAFTCFVTRNCLLLACVLGLVMAVLAPVLVPLIFGARFHASIAVIWWILPGTIALSAGKVMSADITARGKPEFNSLVALGGSVLTVPLDFLLIPWMGINGAALASSITYLLEAAFIALALRSLLKANWRAFLIPAGDDFSVYRSAWQRFRFRSPQNSTELSPLE